MFFQRRVSFFHTCNKDVCTDQFSNYYTNCFEFVLTLVDFFSPSSKNWFQMFKLLKLKTSVCSGCKCMSKKFWNWVKFLWFNLMLVVHLSNIAKYCFNFVLIFYVLRFWTVYIFFKLCKLYIILNVCKLSK